MPLRSTKREKCSRCWTSLLWGCLKNIFTIWNLWSEVHLLSLKYRFQQGDFETNANKEPFYFSLQYSDITKPVSTHKILSILALLCVLQNIAMCLLEKISVPNIFIYVPPSVQVWTFYHLGYNARSDQKNNSSIPKEREEMVCDVILCMHMCHLYGIKPNRLLPMLYH